MALDRDKLSGIADFMLLWALVSDMLKRLL